MRCRRYAGKTRSFLLLTMILVQVLSAIPLGTGGGPTRGPGTDIHVRGITSHKDGEIVGFLQQVFEADVANSGSDPYIGNVSVTLTIMFPGNETENMTEVHKQTVDLGSTLEEVGNETTIQFSPWLPSAEGYYRIRVSSNAFDDNPGNDTVQIMIRVLLSHIEGVKVSFAPGSPSNQKIQRGDNTKMYGYEPFVFEVENTGIFNDTFNITIDSAWVMTPWDNMTRELAPGASDLIVVNVEVPQDIDPLSFDVLVFTATSQRNESQKDALSANISIPLKEDVEVTVASPDPQLGYPGGPYVEFAFRIRNTGDWATYFSLKVSSRPSSWKSEIKSTKMTTMETGNISRDNYIIVYAWIWVPPLNYDTMDNDRTEEGQIGALILTATSPSQRH